MTIRAPLVVVVACAALAGLVLAAAPLGANAAGGKRGSGHSLGGSHPGGGYGSSGSHYRSSGHHSKRPVPGTKRRLRDHSYRRHSNRYYYGGYGPDRLGRYRPYGYGHGRYVFRHRHFDGFFPTPILFYTPRYHGYFPGRSDYVSALERQADSLQTTLYRERYSRFFWRGWPPYYEAHGPSAEGSCLYGADAELIFRPKGKNCASSLVAN